VIAQAPHETESAGDVRYRGTPWLKLSAAVLLSLIAGFVIRNAIPAASVKPVSKFSFSLLLNSRFTNRGRPLLTISPDGTKVVFVADRQLYVRSVDKMDVEPIRGSRNSTGVLSPFFSPDGEWVGYFEASGLRKIPIGGGAPVTLCSSEGSLGATWSRNDTILFADVHGIHRITPDGGTPTLVIPTNPNEPFFLPQFLDDGDHVLFTVAAGRQWDNGEVVVQSVSTGERKVLVQGAADGRYLPPGLLTYRTGSTVFARTFDTKRLVVQKPVAILDAVGYDSNNTGTAQYAFSAAGSLAYIIENTAAQRMNLVDLDGKAKPLDVVGASPRVSPNGKRVLYVPRDRMLWTSDLSGDTGPTRLTFDGDYPGGAAWSPDGLSIAGSTGKGIMVVKADGSGQPEDLVAPNNQEFGYPAGPTWLPPGGNTLFFIGRGGFWSYDISSKTSHALALISGLPLTQQAEISSNGHWIAYHSTETPDVDVFVQPYPPTGAKYQISTGGGHHPMWSPDGKRLYYVKGLEQLMAVDVAADSTFHWSAPIRLKVSVQQGMNESRQFDIMPDGKRFILNRSENTTSAEINVVLNWVEELKQARADALGISTYRTPSDEFMFSWRSYVSRKIPQCLNGTATWTDSR
jgi:serine/threonine-protein kinase